MSPDAWDAYVAAEQQRVAAQLAFSEAERQVDLKTVASFWAGLPFGRQLREHPHFEVWTDHGRCWRCRGPVVAMFGYELLDTDIPQAHVCKLWLTPGGMSRDCAR